MVTMKVTHHLDRQDVVNLLADAYGFDASGEDPPTLSKRQAEKAIRTSLALDGTNRADYWRDHWTDEDECKQIEEWANDQVTRLWPTWSDTG